MLRKCSSEFEGETNTMDFLSIRIAKETAKVTDANDVDQVSFSMLESTNAFEKDNINHVSGHFRRSDSNNRSCFSRSIATEWRHWFTRNVLH